MSIKLRYILALGVSIFLLSIFCERGESKERGNDILFKKAYRAYTFQNFRKTQELLDEIESKDIKCLLLEAFSYHFGIPDNNPEKAYSLYKKILKRIKRETFLYYYIQLLIGECLEDKGRYIEGERIFKLLIQDRKVPVMIQQEAYIDLSIHYIRHKGERGLEDAFKYLKEGIKRTKDGPLYGILCMIMAEILLYENRYQEGLKYMKEWEKSGIENIVRRGDVLFRIARISERLGDIKEAIFYYKKLYTEIPNSNYAYECKEKVKELKKRLEGNE